MTRSTVVHHVTRQATRLLVDVPTSDVGAEDARRTADQVLAGRAYVEAARPPSLRERFIDWVQELIGEVFAALTSIGGRGFIAWIVIGLFALAIVYLVTRLVRNLGPTPLRERPRSATIEIEQELSPEEWLARAHEAEAAGRWRDGVRCRHRSLVMELIRREALAHVPGQTAGEIDYAVAVTVPAAREPMHVATRMFKDIWYGGRDAVPADRDQFEKLAAAVLESLADQGESAVDRPMVAPS